MSEPLILGVDIGVSGAIAIMTGDGDLVEIHDMPTLGDGPKGRRAVNGPLLAEIIGKAGYSRAFVELVGARPGEGSVGAFAFGRSRGVVEARRRNPSGQGEGQGRLSVRGNPPLAIEGRAVRPRQG